MQQETIIKLLEKHQKEDVENFASYCVRISLAKKRDGSLQNPWIQYKTEKQVAALFERVAKDGLVFDGVHVTLQSTGISYDYIAYKNKMFLAYPESTIDVSLVYDGDDFAFRKVNGKVEYTHVISNPFTQKNLTGGYCIIKNKRGDFITLLSKEDIDKHRKVAKTDFIWQQWFTEMALKTVIKKACKLHFSDIFQNIEKNDNENYELENPLGLDIKFKKEIDAIETMKDLKTYWEKNKGKGKEFDKYILIRKKQINADLQNGATK